MSQPLLSRAVEGDEAAFRELTDSYRRELQFHCYRFLGSVQDAEDALQETLVSAWRGLAGFQPRSSLRAWLYRIATNRCLDALRDSRRRPPPAPDPPFPPPAPTRMAEPTNTQPAFGCYRDDEHAPIAHSVGRLVLTLEGHRIAAITNFMDSSVLPRFGLPRTLRL